MSWSADIDRYAGADGDVVNEFMPVGTPTPTLAERERLSEWIACGLPQ